MFRGLAGHDLGVLVVLGQPAHLVNVLPATSPTPAAPRLRGRRRGSSSTARGLLSHPRVVVTLAHVRVNGASACRCHRSDNAASNTQRSPRSISSTSSRCSSPAWDQSDISCGSPPVRDSTTPQARPRSSRAAADTAIGVVEGQNHVEIAAVEGLHPESARSPEDCLAEPQTRRQPVDWRVRQAPAQGKRRSSRWSNVRVDRSRTATGMRTTACDIARQYPAGGGFSTAMSEPRDRREGRSQYVRSTGCVRILNAHAGRVAGTSHLSAKSPGGSASRTPKITETRLWVWSVCTAARVGCVARLRPPPAA